MPLEVIIALTFLVGLVIFMLWLFTGSFLNALAILLICLMVTTGIVWSISTIVYWTEEPCREYPNIPACRD